MDKEITGELKRAAEEKLAFVQKDSVTDANASILFSMAYDALRLTLQAHASKGTFDARGHETLIDYCHNIRFLSTEEASRAHAFRLKRNDIEYRAKRASIEQARAIIAFARKLLNRLGK